MTGRPAIRVYVNGASVDLADGATALDAVRAWDAGAAQAVEQGARVITDSRGLPTPPHTAVQWGSIFRLVPWRVGDPAVDDDAQA
jgi:hypothetical protein